MLQHGVGDFRIIASIRYDGMIVLVLVLVLVLRVGNRSDVYR